MNDNEVPDIEFLARKALCFDREPKKHLAYWEGLIAGLRIVESAIEVDISDIDYKFWHIVSGISHPRPGGKMLAKLIAEFSTPSIQIDGVYLESDLERNKEFVEAYYQGMGCAVELSLLKVTQAFRKMYGDDWQRISLDWASRKLKWAYDQRYQVKEGNLF